jgi:predicted choloylglycine hydrolase
MKKRYVFAREERPDAAWRARFAAGRPEAESWYRQGRADPSSAAACRAALARHMPGLLAEYDRVSALVGDDELAHCILSHYRPPPLVTGCSAAVWLAEGGPALVRNYDYPLHVVSDRFESTAWFGREVIAKAQRPWGGCLDGMNEDGLVASMNFGGSPASGEGFSGILMLRYVLETCRCVAEAAAALIRIPIAQSQNIVLLDRSGAYATVFLGPGRAPAVMQLRACTNHQEQIVWPEHAARWRTVERLKIVQAALDDPAMTLVDLTALFLKPPVYSRSIASTTAYTAVYRPAEGRVDYIWPGKVWTQYIGKFEVRDYTHDYGELVA